MNVTFNELLPCVSVDLKECDTVQAPSLGIWWLLVGPASNDSRLVVCDSVGGTREGNATYVYVDGTRVAPDEAPAFNVTAVEALQGEQQSKAASEVVAALGYAYTWVATWWDWPW